MIVSDVTSEIVSTVEFAGRFDRVTGVTFHGDGLLRLDVWLEKGEGIAFLDIRTEEMVAVRSSREFSCPDRHGNPDVWFQFGDGLAMLAGEKVRVWPDIRGETISTFPIANPEHHASDRFVLADEFRRRPRVLHIEPMWNGSATVLCSDNFYQSGGRYLTRLRFQDDAFHWSGPYRQIDESEVRDGWTDRTFNLYETPLIHGICEDGAHVFCVTRGGTATMLNHGPAFQTNLLIRFRRQRPAETSRHRFGLRSLFSRRSQAEEEPTFVFEDVVARPEGVVIFDRRTGGHAVKLRGKNRMEFYDASGKQPSATLALTPKRSLGKFKHNEVGLAIQNDLLAVCGQGKLNLCRIEQPRTTRPEATGTDPEFEQ